MSSKGEEEGEEEEDVQIPSASSSSSSKISGKGEKPAENTTLWEVDTGNDIHYDFGITKKGWMSILKTNKWFLEKFMPDASVHLIGQGR